MVGGARAFGPTPRDYRIDLPKKARRLALRSALSAKAKDGQVTILTDAGVAEGKTREVFGLLQKLGLTNGRSLLIVEANDPKVIRASRNLPRVTTSSAAQVSTYEILRADHVLITSAALEAMKETRARGQVKEVR
jgi:large subunit ribosomal protein L4